MTPNHPETTRTPRTASGRGIAVVSLGLGLCVLAGKALEGHASDKPVEIRLVTLAPRGTSVHLSLLQLGEQWQQISAGRVRLTVIPDYRAGGEGAIVDKMDIGGVDAALMTIVGLSKINPDVTALAVIPMMFRSLDEVDYVSEQLHPQLEKRLAQKHYVALFWGDIGWVQYFTTQPLIHPADLKKMKVFAWAGNAEQVDLMKDWGTTPVVLEPSDILVGLSNGMLDAVAATPFSANAGQFATVTKHMLELNWAPLVGGAVVRQATWNKIPADLRPALLQAAAQTGRNIKVAARKESDDAVEAMKIKQGLIVHRPTPDVVEEWRATAATLYPKIRGKLVPAEVFDKVEPLLTDYRAGRGER